MTPAEFARGLRNAKRMGPGKWRGCCPAHPDKHASLDVKTGADGRVLVICRSRRCTAESITRALGLTLRDLFPNDRPLTHCQWNKARRRREAEEERRAAEIRARVEVERELANNEREAEAMAVMLAEKIRSATGAETERLQRLRLLRLAAAARERARWFALHCEWEMAEDARAEAEWFRSWAVGQRGEAVSRAAA